METSLHRVLKEQYAQGVGGRSEVRLGGFRIDAVCADGVLVEIQSGPLGPLRTKLKLLLPDHVIRVVKPVVVQRRVVRRARRDGADLSARCSPKRGRLLDLFDDLVGLARLFPHPNLEIEAIAVSIDEVRIERRRRPGFAVVDRGLREIVQRSLLRRPVDLWGLLPDHADWSVPFTTADIACRIDRPAWFAQRVAYCLLHSKAVLLSGKQGRHRLYQKVS